MEKDKEQRKQKLSKLEEIDNPIVRKALERRKEQFMFNYGDSYLDGSGEDSDYAGLGYKDSPRYFDKGYWEVDELQRP